MYNCDIKKQDYEKVTICETMPKLLVIMLDKKYIIMKNVWDICKLLLWELDTFVRNTIAIIAII